MQISKFRGVFHVDIRRFFFKGDTAFPTRKGVSLSVDNWRKLQSLFAEIDAELTK